MQSILLKIAGAGLALLLSACAAAACSCMESPTVDREFAESKAVVLVKAVAHLGPEDKNKAGGDRVSGFKFAVQKVFKSNALKPGQEFQMISNGMCNAFGFEAGDLGREFLIYYYTEEYLNALPLCSRSGPVESRAADLKYLENIDKVRGLTRISGVLAQQRRGAVEGEAPPKLSMEGRTVRIVGQGRDLQVRTDENGVYEAYGLPPGQYRIEPERIRGYMPSNGIKTRMDSVAVVIFGRGHAEVDFYYSPANAIRGTLLDQDGKPLPGVDLQLVPASGKTARYFIEHDSTDKNGKFEFESIPPGRYVVVGNEENEITAEYPYPKFYSSGTGDRATAEEIAIDAGEVREGLTMRAPRAAEVVTITGRLLYKDGTPAATNATVKFFTGAAEEPRQPGGAYAYPDKNGNFRLRLVKGQKGRVYGYIVPNDQIFSACREALAAAVAAATGGNKDRFPSTVPVELEATGDRAGYDIVFDFSLCPAR